ncbi:MAG: 2-octaprenyl-6-methoxyphenyl hydroxylase [Wenzhouxiangellaceae bacterium]
MQDNTVQPGHDVDIAIIGGGLVGASLALALRACRRRSAIADGQGRPLRVAVIEPFTPTADSQPSYDDRTLVLNEVSAQILDQLGLGGLLVEHGEPIHSIHVSDRGRAGRTLLHAAEHQREAFGHVVVARAIGQAMHAAISQAEDDAAAAACRLQWLSPARLQHMQQHADGVELQLHGEPQRLRCRLVVGADGADSLVRQQVGLPAQQHDYCQTAIICNVTPQQPHQGCAYERFTGTGPLALLPQPGGRMGVVMCVRSDDAAALLALPDDDFLAQLQQRFGRRLGSLQRLGKRASYPLRLVAAEQHVRQRTVLIGNAAHTIHPVSAQGFNLGLRDAWVLAHSLAAAWARADFAATGTDITAVLHDYQAQREADQRDTIRYTDTLARLYSNEALPARLLRSAGLIAHQLLPGMQQALVLRAMGYRSSLPGLQPPSAAMQAMA